MLCLEYSLAYLFSTQYIKANEFTWGIVVELKCGIPHMRYAINPHSCHSSTLFYRFSNTDGDKQLGWGYKRKPLIPTLHELVTMDYFFFF